MFPPGLFIPDFVPPSVADGTVKIDPAALEKLRTALVDAAELLESGKFRDLELADSAFGGRPTATELGHEHRTAHKIIADTIAGVTSDLWGYRDGVQRFEQGMMTADDVAAADLQREQVAVEALAESSALNHGESSYHDSQRTNLTGRPEVTPGEGDLGTTDPAATDPGGA
jgi:hypothetical protein